MNIIITGSTGFLGPYLVKEFTEQGNVIGVSRSKLADYQCELTSPAEVSTMMLRFEPDIVVHAAAMTDVEECRKQPNVAVNTNCKATENVAAFAPIGCRLIYISTDMVYSGQGPHKEHSRSENPINMYGMSKFMGEYAIANRQNHLIIRTNMFGFSIGDSKPSSLVNFLVQKFRSGTPVQLFTDSFFSPLSTTTLCKYLRRMTTNERTGVYNLGSTGGMSKSKFALMLANELKLQSYAGVPTESASIPNRTPRPLDTRLDISRVENHFGFTMPTLENEIKNMCKDHKCAH